MRKRFDPDSYAHVTERFLHSFAITGTSGVGTSTLFHRLEERFPRHRSLCAGDLMRSLYPRAGFPNIDVFVKYMKEKPGHGYDDYVDNQVALTASKDKSIVDGRVSWLFAPWSFKIKVICPILVCAKRRRAQLIKKYGSAPPFDEVLKSLIARNSDDAERYTAKYPGYELWTNNMFDIVINSGVWDEANVERIALKAYAAWSLRMRRIMCADRVSTKIIRVPFPRTPVDIKEYQMAAVA